VKIGDSLSEVVPSANGGIAVPISLDGVRYGSFDVRPIDGQVLNHDTEEYLRIVANQTANLLRAIELYHELSRGAVRDERAQLARELHDGLAQDLAVLRMQLSGDQDGSDEQELADRALSEARYAITILRGRTAAPADFFAALRRQSDDLADRFDCQVVIEQSDPMLGISGAAQVALLRICREAIANAGKHGKPSRVVLTVRQLPETVQVEISDDGIGFDPAAPVRSGAFGLKGMSERAALLGGELTIRSHPGEGTTITVCLPSDEGLVQ
jgi:two-component system nitrate/nitrite sensor histidine kinase NarQ